MVFGWSSIEDHLFDATLLSSFGQKLSNFASRAPIASVELRALHFFAESRGACQRAAVFIVDDLCDDVAVGFQNAEAWFSRCAP